MDQPFCAKRSNMRAPTGDEPAAKFRIRSTGYLKLRIRNLFLAKFRVRTQGPKESFGSEIVRPTNFGFESFSPVPPPPV